MYNRCLDDISMWCNKILPTVFDDSLSYLECVMRLKTIVKEMIDKIKILTNSNIALEKKYTECILELEKLQKTIDDFIKGYTIKDGSITIEKLAPDFKIELKKIVENTITNIAKFVWFGLDDNGYFIAVIPDNWKEITFSTNENDCLVLEY